MGKSAQTTVEGRRTELVSAAYALIAEKGLEGFRTRDVASKVGINISTLHYYFPAKQDLLVSVVEHVSELFKTLRAPLPPNATSLDELHCIFESQSHRHRVAPQLEVVVQELMLRASRDEQVRLVMEAQQRAWHAMVKETIARCIRDGHLAADLDADAAANVVTSVLIGANLQLGIRAGSFDVNEASRQLISWMTARPSR